MDKEKYKNMEILYQMLQLALDGTYGHMAKKEALRIKDKKPNSKLFLEYVQLVFNELEEEEINQILINISTYIIIIYRDVKKVSSELAYRFLASIFLDYPNSRNSCLAIKLKSLIESSISFKKIITIKDKLILFENSKSLIGSYTEFLNGLLGWLCLCVRCILNKKIKKTIFDMPYGKKVEDFKNNTYCLMPEIINILNVGLRNAIAHKTIWFDINTNIIKYKDYEKEYSISIDEFMAITYIGSRLGQIFVFSLMILFVFEYGTKNEFDKLPTIYKEILNNHNK